MVLLSYRRHRFPPPIIQHAIWLYLRFTLSYRDVEDLLAERGLDLSYETVRRWVLKFAWSRLRLIFTTNRHWTIKGRCLRQPFSKEGAEGQGGAGEEAGAGLIVGKNLEMICDGCGIDVTYTGNRVGYRLALKVEARPMHPELRVFTLMGVFPPLGRDHYFCNLGCLARWTDRLAVSASVGQRLCHH